MNDREERENLTEGASMTDTQQKSDKKRKFGFLKDKFSKISLGKNSSRDINIEAAGKIQGDTTKTVLGIFSK